MAPLTQFCCCGLICLIFSSSVLLVSNGSITPAAKQIMSTNNTNYLNNNTWVTGQFDHYIWCIQIRFKFMFIFLFYSIYQIIEI